jgi:hypothetical protein
MEIREIQCDREGCGVRSAVQFSIFAERKMDGAGSMEDWFHVFDLCPQCQRNILIKFFNTCPHKAKQLVDEYKINTRLG